MNKPEFQFNYDKDKYITASKLRWFIAWITTHKDHLPRKMNKGSNHKYFKQTKVFLEDLLNGL